MSEVLDLYIEDSIDALVYYEGSYDREPIFGVRGWRVNGKHFAAVSREGRAAIRLTDPGTVERLLDIDGAGPWCNAAGVHKDQWYLLPSRWVEKFEDIKIDLWIRKAADAARCS